MSVCLRSLAVYAHTLTTRSHVYDCEHTHTPHTHADACTQACTHTHTHTHADTQQDSIQSGFIDFE